MLGKLINAGFLLIIIDGGLPSVCLAAHCYYGNNGILEFVNARLQIAVVGVCQVIIIVLVTWAVIYVN